MSNSGEAAPLLANEEPPTSASSGIGGSYDINYSGGATPLTRRKSSARDATATATSTAAAPDVYDGDDSTRAASASAAATSYSSGGAEDDVVAGGYSSGSPRVSGRDAYGEEEEAGGRGAPPSSSAAASLAYAATSSGRLRMVGEMVFTSLVFAVCGAILIACCAYSFAQSTIWYWYKLDTGEANVYETYDSVQQWQPLADLYFQTRCLMASGVAIEVFVCVGVILTQCLRRFRWLYFVWMFCSFAGVALLIAAAYVFLAYHPSAMTDAGICVAKASSACTSFYGDLIGSGDTANEASWHPKTGWMMTTLAWPVALIVLIETIWARASPH
ncbi:hypothetical protein Pelo_12736 [Pelomyxa schiedti]|nr:hypothetical protein Pelo_12736 [Pelomyxa schiedti]